MIAYWELAKLDFLALRRWFSTQTVVKIIILLAYLGVLLGVGLGVYFWSDAFFRYIVEYEAYGHLTAQYILRASFLVLIWIGILSSMITTMTFLLTNDRHLDLLMTRPISPLTLSLRGTIRSSLLTFTLLIISIFPLAYSYTDNFFGSLLSLFWVLLITESVGAVLGYSLSLLVRSKGGFVWGISSISAILYLTWILLRTAFPSELQSLSDVSLEQFTQIFNNLPLTKGYWPMGSLVEVASGMYSKDLYLPAFSVAVLGLSIYAQKQLFVACRQAQKLHSVGMFRDKSGLVGYSNLNLVTKDLLAVIRNPKDLGYLVFLLAMVIAFFGLFTRGYLARGIPQRFQTDALAFAFSWLVFFAGTYLLRLSYPLTVNEGMSRWWFFTRPHSPSKLILDKILTSLCLALPLIALSLVEWKLLPFIIYLMFFVIMSLMAIISLAISMPAIGSIFPDFSLAYQADKSSSTMAGLLSTLYIFILGAGGAYLISQALRMSIPISYAINAYLAFNIVCVSAVWIGSVKFFEHYTVDV